MRPERQGGFSLIELVIVIVIGGLMAAALVVFIRPATESFVAQRGRATLQGATQAALQVMTRDLRNAVPNSLRTPNANCFQLLPTVGGGRYRMAPDIVNDAPGCPNVASCAAWVDTSTTTARFDVLGDVNGRLQTGDHIVIGNLRVNDAYAGLSRSNITGVAASPNANFGTRRVTIGARQFPAGYTGGRFFVVPNSERAVTYSCVNAGVDARGDGTGVLRRLRAGFTAAYPTSCPTTGDVVATRVAACRFEYSLDALSEYGLMSLNIELARGGERLAMQSEIMLSNLP